ncbi:MAG TPA: WYL domain-containing protein, partial [Bacteroidales bacterium]|nr:WYL domain-containing protein [Bacteroidales bacterium]
YHFKCEQITIKRDLSELRANGIDIHSSGKKGIVIDNSLTKEQIQDLLFSYFSSAVNKQYDKALRLLVSKQKEKSIPIITTLQKGMEENKKVIIDYQRNESKNSYKCEIDPIMFFQSSGKWRLLARDEEILKQFLVDKISSAELTKKKFHKIPKEEIDQLFEGSFRSWIGSEKHKVKLRFYPPWVKRIKPNQMMETQVITENEDSSIDLEMTVNSLSEVAGWIVSRGKGVEVIEPKTLRDEVIKLAGETLANYNKRGNKVTA